MAVPLLTKKIVKKRVKQFKRPQWDRKICVKVVTVDELRDDVEYNAILEDMREGGKFVSLVNVVIPRPDANGEWSPGVGKVFLEYADDVGSTMAKTALHGRKFGGKDVNAVYYPEEKYSNRDYGA